MTVLGPLTTTRKVVPPLPVLLADDVSQKVWLSLIVLNMEGPTSKLVKLFSFVWKVHELVVSIYMVAAMTGSLM